MSDYATHLESAKSAALAALTDLLAATTDPIEKRRIATTILRIPTPRDTQRAPGCRGSARQPVPTTSSASSPPAPDLLAPSPNSSTQPFATESSLPIHTTQPPLSNPLDFIRQSNALLSMLSTRPKPTRRPATTPTSLLAAAGQAPSG